MDYLLFLILTFFIGVLLGWFRPYHIQVLWWTIKNNVPRRCPVCGTWYATKDMIYAKHRIAGFAHVCKSCWINQYMPFSKNKE